MVGDDRAGDRVIDLLKDLGVDPGGVVRVGERPTTRKTRVQARSQQMLRVDRETDEPISSSASRQLLRAVDAVLPGGQVIRDTGYRAGFPGIDPEGCEIRLQLNRQSPDIHRGVEQGGDVLGVHGLGRRDDGRAPAAGRCPIGASSQRFIRACSACSWAPSAWRRHL